MRHTVLLPPPTRARRPLPGWLAFVAVTGLAILVCSTIPAVLRRTRLARDLDGLERQVLRQEHQVRGLEQMLKAAQEDSFAYERALRGLIEPPTAPATSPQAPPR